MSLSKKERSHSEHEKRFLEGKTDHFHQECVRTPGGSRPSNSGPDAVVVTFNDGTTETFDLVIGADGVHSRTCALLFGPEQHSAGIWATPLPATHWLTATASARRFRCITSRDAWPLPIARHRRTTSSCFSCTSHQSLSVCHASSGSPTCARCSLTWAG